MEQVGALYRPGRSHWPEATIFELTSAGPRLCLFFAAPADAEVQAVREGVVELGLLLALPALVLLYRFGGAIRWSDRPFSVHQMPEQPELLREPLEGERDLLRVVLVDADTGVIRVDRLLRLGPVFTRTLRHALLAQQAEAWDATAYDAAVRALYQRCPDSAEMVAEAVLRWSTAKRSRVETRATRWHGGLEHGRGGHPPGTPEPGSDVRLGPAGSTAS